MSEYKFSEEPELAVLNIIINNPDVVYSVPNLKFFMFNSSPNSLIFSTIIELAERNLLPDHSLLASNLSSTGKLPQAGGIEYLNYLRGLIYQKDNLKEFERQIVNNYKARCLLSKLTETQGKLNKGDDVSNVINTFKHELENLEATGGGEQVVTFLDATATSWKEIVGRVENPGIRGVTTGFSDIDLHTGGYNPGDLWIVAGRPGMGKSTDMCNSALSVAENGNPVLMFSLEMNKSALVERMIAIKTGVPLQSIRLGSLTKAQLETISDMIRHIKNLPIYIDTNFGTDEGYFAITTRKYHSMHGVRVVFFDYVQLASERGSNQTAEIGAFSRTAKLLSNDLGITTVMYSQLNRQVEMREDDKRPILSDLRQSGSLEEDADIAMFLYRDEIYYPNTTKYKGIVEKIFRKHRNGPTGTIFQKFDENTLRISEERKGVNSGK